jgi:hypothetical protein
MGCDIHIVIQCQEPDGAWQNVPWQSDLSWTNKDYRDKHFKADVPVAPDAFDSRNYNNFAILADVRNGHGFAGIKTGEGWPSIAPHRGLPEGVAEPDDYSLGDHSFTWVSLDELKAFDWDGTVSWLYGCVTADEYERLSVMGKSPESWSGDISGPGIRVYEPDDYKREKLAHTLVERPYVRMGWPETARDATGDWIGTVAPWLDELAAGRPLRLVMGFDS